jgi:hypothetical protein
MPCQCPSCRSPNCQRSRLRWYDWARMMLLQHPFRCHSCFHRFYRFILTSSPKPAEPTAVMDLTAKKP